MAAEGLDLKLNLVGLFTHLSGDELKLFLALAERSKQPDNTLTPADLAQVCNFTIDHVTATLNTLQEKHDMIKMEGTAKKGTITLNQSFFLDNPKPIKYHQERQERTVEELQARIMHLERELVRVETGDEDNLTPWLKGEEQQFVKEVVGFYGRPLTTLESYFLGQMIQGFGCARVKRAFYMRKGNKSPLRSAYALLKNGASGKPAQEKEGNMPPRVHYRDLTKEAE